MNDGAMAGVGNAESRAGLRRETNEMNLNMLVLSCMRVYRSHEMACIFIDFPKLTVH